MARRIVPDDYIFPKKVAPDIIVYPSLIKNDIYGNYSYDDTQWDYAKLLGYSGQYLYLKKDKKCFKVNVVEFYFLNDLDKWLIPSLCNHVVNFRGFCYVCGNSIPKLLPEKLQEKQRGKLLSKFPSATENKDGVIYVTYTRIWDDGLIGESTYRINGNKKELIND